MNDADGNGRKGWVTYMSGIGSGKDPAQFGDLILADESTPPDVTPPLPVKNVKAGASTSQAIVTWTEEAGDADLANVAISWKETGSTAAPSTATLAKGIEAYTIPNLHAGKTYEITVFAQDEAGNRAAGVQTTAKTTIAGITINALTGTVNVVDGGQQIDVKTHPFNADAQALSSAYMIKLKKNSAPVSIDFFYDRVHWSNIDTGKLCIYRVHGNNPKNWDAIGGIVDPQTGHVTANITEDGTYVLLLME